MAIQVRECQARECRGMVDMNKEEVLVEPLTIEEATLPAILPTPSRTFHRVTQVSQACPVQATPNLLR